MRTKYLVTALVLLGITTLAPTANALLDPWQQYLCNQYRDNRFNAEYGFDTSDPWSFSNMCSGGGGGGYDPTYGGGGYEPVGGGGGGGGSLPVPPRLPPITVSGGTSDTSDDTGGYIPNPYTGPKPPRTTSDTGPKPWILNNTGSSNAQTDPPYPTSGWMGGGMELDPNAVQSPMYHQESVRAYEDQQSAAQYVSGLTKTAPREAFQIKAETARKQFQAKLNTKAAEIAPEIQTQQEELLVKIETFADTRKKTIVARMDEAFSSINKKWIATFTKSVDHMNGVLEAIISRSMKEQAAGKDVTEVQAKIGVAQLAIANARGVIVNQTGNSYTISVQEESTAKTDVLSTRDDLKQDLEAVRTAVRAAYEATKAAAQALRTVTTNAK